MSELSQIEKALFFPALNSEVLAAATAEALAFIDTTVGETGQDVRNHMQQYFKDLPYEGWGEATAVCLQQVVIDAFLNNQKTTSMNTAFITDQQMFLESIAYGANIDNPWVLDLDGDGAADAGRAEALNARIYVIAVSHGGDANATWTLDDVPVTAVGVVEDLSGGL